MSSPASPSAPPSPPTPPAPEPPTPGALPWWVNTAGVVLPVVSVLLSIFDQIPEWTTPIAILIAGGFAWTIAHRGTADPLRKTWYITAITAATCLLAMGVAVHQWPELAGAKEKQDTTAPSTPQKKQNSKTPTLKVTSLRDGQCIPWLVNVRGTGAIPPGTEVWVAHTNNKNGTPADTLMNLRQATNIGVRNEWQTDEFAIGDEKDSRSFWIFVYVLPAEAGFAIKNQLFPDGFRDKDNWPHWNNSLHARFEQKAQLGAYEVFRSAEGC